MIYVTIEQGLVSGVLVNGSTDEYVVLDGDVEGCKDDEVAKVLGEEVFATTSRQTFPASRRLVRDVERMIEAFKKGNS